MSSLNVVHDPAIEGCLDSCRRVLRVVHAVTPEVYRAKWQGRNGLGTHLRHCLEHLSALRDGTESGVVDYDSRERNAQMEQEPAALTSAMEEIMDWLATLEPDTLEQSLSARQIPRIDTPPILSGTSLRRELLFVTSHTIHHLALVSMLAELQGIDLPHDLGVAYSTATHEHQQAALAIPANAL